jgi:NADPH:quinone reductase-like Zn-dependent oxidoreductase
LVRNVDRSRERLNRLGAAMVVDQLDDEFDVILDAVGGATFGLAIEHVARRGVVVNIATPSDDDTVTFRGSRFDRAQGARIYTLNLFDELRSHASAASDLARLCGLMVEGRLDGQIEFEGPWREPAPAMEALLHRRIGGKAVLHVDR